MYDRLPRILAFCTALLLATTLFSGCNAGSTTSSSSSSSSSSATATTTALAASASAATTGASVTLVATVSPSAATGTVTFYSGSTALGSATVSSGTATLATSFSTAGTYALTAVYGGSSSYATSTSSAVSITVSAPAASTTTTLSTSTTTATSGTAVTLTATVSPTVATGSVTFYDGSTSLGSTALSSGTATLSSSSLAVGSHSVTAVYGGSTSYAGSTSSAVVVTIAANGDSFNLSTGANSADLVENETIAYTINFDLASLTATTTSNGLVIDNAARTITLDGATVLSFSEDSTLGVTLNSSFPDGTVVDYVLSGNYTRSVLIYSLANFKLTLNGVTIASTNGPAINIQSEKRAYVYLPAGTTTTLSDSSTYTKRYLGSGTAMDLKATFFSEGPLVFTGAGALKVSSVAKHAICSDKHVRQREGTLTLTPTLKDGIRTNNAFVMDGGTLAITTPTSGGKGIKVEGKESTTNPLGFIAINNGALTLNTYDKAIMAAWEGDEDGETTTTADDPDPRVTINGGAITITTTGTPVEDVLAPEGIESKSLLTINGGTITVNATDDGLNGGTGLVVNGGTLYVTSSANDAVDSNGYMTVTGGLMVLHGANGVETGFDCDGCTFTVSGGTFVALAGSMTMPTATASTQNTLFLKNLKTAGLLGIKDGAGNVVFAYQVPDTSAAILLSSPKLATGTAYTLYMGGTLGSWTQNFNGLYVDPAVYSGGTSKSSFTLSSRITTLTF